MKNTKIIIAVIVVILIVVVVAFRGNKSVAPAVVDTATSTDMVASTTTI